MRIEHILKEAYRLYHDSFSDAIHHAVAETRDRGYQFDADDFHNKITTGPRKPDPGKYNRYSVDLLRDGEPTDEQLHIQIYNMDDTSKFELNMYIS